MRQALLGAGGQEREVRLLRGRQAAAGNGTCRYLNAERVGDYIIGKARERILTELVTLVAEEIDALAGEVNGRLKAIEANLADVEDRLESLYQALETKQSPVEALSPRILSLKGQRGNWSGGGRTCPPAGRPKGTWRTSESSWWKGRGRGERPYPQLREGVEVVEDEAVLTYTIAMPRTG